MRISLVAALLGMTLSVSAADETFGGLPRAERRNVETTVEVLHNPGFLVGYSEFRKQPLWVAYQARAVGRRKLPPRPARFETDPRTHAHVTTFDYNGTHYDRGHLAPNYLIGKLYGAKAQQATFLMSNISPQTRRLNKLVWQRLEEAEADVVAPDAEQLWVLAGPLFGEHPRTFKKSRIPIPESFFRVWLVWRSDGAHALAFIVPQSVCGTEPLSEFIVPVDEIEKRTGLDFFSELPDREEDSMERSTDTTRWRLDRYDDSPPRYAKDFGPLKCPAH